MFSKTRAWVFGLNTARRLGLHGCDEARHQLAVEEVQGRQHHVWEQHVERQKQTAATVDFLCIAGIGNVLVSL